MTMFICDWQTGVPLVRGDVLLLLDELDADDLILTSDRSGFGHVFVSR